ncbi:MAG TPA: hypothetical protein VLT88_06135 [Desulfosarcina sp.]|nr:hypothetical protein [Desulfosarcina sp.]
MHAMNRYGWLLAVLLLGIGRPAAGAESVPTPGLAADRLPCAGARLVGRIASDRLVECSGMETSLADRDLLWAVNDGGGGPFVYALGVDGRDRGRFRVAGVGNRDWEGMDTFLWQGRPMILIADFGDNQRQYATHSIFILEEPRLDGERLVPTASVGLRWRIDFAYPDGPHDAEGVAVDRHAGEILVLTKRDAPPRLFALPLQPPAPGVRVTARPVTVLNRIPRPTREDLRHPYGDVRSQPTAMDLSADGRSMIVLTYKHAYLFSRTPGESWAGALGRGPALIRLPLPQYCRELRQREAVCFSRDESSLLVTSEGQGAGIFRLAAR